MTDTSLPARLGRNQWIVSWDHREQIPFDRLAEALSDLTNGTLHLHEAETESDQYALVIADGPLSQREANEIYRIWWRVENEPT